MTILLTLGVVVIALICFVAEWFPADITAIGVTIALLLLGLVNPEEGISGFGNSATITVLAMFILSAGVERTGAVQVIGDVLRRWGGKSPSQQILSMGSVVGPITAFINNTAVVAIFLPIIEDWCRKQNISPSKLMMPLSFVTILGGMITTIGTSTNVLASGISEQLGYGAFSLFQFTPLGVIIFIIGMIFLAFIAPKLLPVREAPSSEEAGQTFGLKDYVSEIVIPPGSRLVGKSLRSSELQHKFDIDVLELIRGNEYFPQPLADKQLQAGDILLVRSKTEELLEIKEEEGIDILADVLYKNTLENRLSTAEDAVVEVLILSNSNLIGSTLKELQFRQRYNSTVLAIRRGEELFRDRLSETTLQFGDLLLIQGPRENLIGLQTERDLLVVERQNSVEGLRRDKAWIAVAIILGVIITAAFNWVPILISALAGMLLMVLTGCLKPQEVYQAVRWNIIFLLAGLIPLGIAMENTGANHWLAENLISVGGSLSGFWILAFFYAITSLITEILSNNASVVLLLPIAVDVAKTLGLNPFAFMMAVTFGASSSFMTPIGYQTNTMVYGPGGYRFLDFVRVGAPLNILLMVVTPLLIVWLYGL